MSRLDLEWVLAFVLSGVMACGGDPSAAPSSGPSTGSGTGVGGGGTGGSGGNAGHVADMPGVIVTANSFAILRLDAATPPSELRFHHATSAPGFSASIPVAGDFDGDGADTLGLFAPRTRLFQLRNENAPGDDDVTVAIDVPADPGESAAPVVGDFDGDGTDTVGEYRPASARFLLTQDNSGRVALDFSFGPTGERAIPFAGDFDGDGVDTVAVYLPRDGRFLLAGANAAGNAAYDFTLSATDGYPVAGDFDGDGIDGVAVFDKATHTLHVADDVNAPSAITTISLHEELLDDFPATGGELVFPIVPVAGVWQEPNPAIPDDTYPWVAAQPADVGLDETALEAVTQEASALEHVHSLLVVRHGKLAWERYFRGYDATIGGNIKSCSKSVLSALFGIAASTGALGGSGEPLSVLAEPWGGYLPAYFPSPQDPKAQITLGDMLTMRAGLSWTDQSQLGDMIASDDWVGFVTARPLVATPGTVFAYSTGLTHVGSAIIESATQQRTHAYARDNLFDPIGVRAVRWDYEPNPSGVDVGGAEVYLRPRDMARFGQLYLDKGCVVTAETCPTGQQLVPSEWVSWSTSNVTGTGYGGWWWLQNFSGHPTFHALGHGGQHIFVVPSLRLVTVMTSRWKSTYMESSAQVAANKTVFTHLLATAISD